MQAPKDAASLAANWCLHCKKQVKKKRIKYKKLVAKRKGKVEGFDFII